MSPLELYECLIVHYHLLFSRDKLLCPGVQERGRNFQIALGNADGVKREVRGCLFEVTFVHVYVWGFFLSCKYLLKS